MVTNNFQLIYILLKSKLLFDQLKYSYNETKRLYELENSRLYYQHYKTKLQGSIYVFNI